jgi:hypothetical protein
MWVNSAARSKAITSAKTKAAAVDTSVFYLLAIGIEKYDVKAWRQLWVASLMSEIRFG